MKNQMELKVTFFQKELNPVLHSQLVFSFLGLVLYMHLKTSALLKLILHFFANQQLLLLINLIVD